MKTCVHGINGMTFLEIQIYVGQLKSMSIFRHIKKYLWLLFTYKYDNFQMCIKKFVFVQYQLYEHKLLAGRNNNGS